MSSGRSVPSVFILSDGQGEDWVGVQIALALQQLLPVQVTALPLVGEGELYRQQQFSVLGGQWLPSGGFTFKHWQAFWQDWQGGLAGHSWQVAQSAVAGAGQVNLLLAVGDILPLVLAWRVGRPYAFVGCTKSDYYCPGRRCYLWPERFLMNHPRCLHTFTRDQTTAERLAELGVTASYQGNPMMDGLGVQSEPPSETGFTIGLLPGSRPGETQANFLQLLDCAQALQALSSIPVHFMAAIAPGLGLASFLSIALAQGWQWQEPYLYAGKTRIWLRTAAFGKVLGASQLFFAMAGTATEQAVGLGRPVITLPGEGPQFTLRFAQLQCQLLGESVLLGLTPQACAHIAWDVLHSPQRLKAIRTNGSLRMGQPGGAMAIARYLQKFLEK